MSNFFKSCRKFFFSSSVHNINFFKTYGLDINPASYGITEEMFADMWLKARTVRTGRITVLDETKHDITQLNEIYAQMREAK